VSDTARDDRLPPPLPDEDAAARRAENSIPPPDGSEPSQLRRVAKPLLIGLVGVLISMAIPILIVIVLAIVAQLIISH
jgi:hypothetical protein